MIDLHHADCFDAMRSIATGSVDLVCCDPPYGTTACKWDTPLDLPLLWQEYARICKPSAAVVLFAQTPFDKVLGVSNIHDLRYEIVWEKTNATGFLNARKMPMRAHENILVFYKCLPTYNPQKTFGHNRKTASRDNGAVGEVYRKGKGTSTYDSTERYPRSVLKFAKDKPAAHPTQKPLALVEWLIRTYSNPRDLVLDNCMGSGTTAVACRNLSRRCVGIEKDAGYFAVAERRVAA